MYKYNTLTSIAFCRLCLSFTSSANRLVSLIFLLYSMRLSFRSREMGDDEGERDRVRERERVRLRERVYERLPSRRRFREDER